MTQADADEPPEPDPVIEAYKKDVDRTLLRENLKLTPWGRLEKHQGMARLADRWRGRARRAGLGIGGTMIEPERADSPPSQA